MKAASEITIDGWEEHTYHEDAGGGKLTRAHVKQIFNGDIQGQGDVRWLMCYRSDGTADFVGLAHFAGRVGDRSGTIVLEIRGTFDGRAATGPVRIVPGSGTDGLRGISGKGELSAPRGSQVAMTLSYRYE